MKNRLIIITAMLAAPHLQAFTCPANSAPVSFARLTPQEVSLYRTKCNYVADLAAGNLIHASNFTCKRHTSTGLV